MQRGPVEQFPVKDKIVLVTGGGSGIGLSFVKECHRNGAKVVIGDLSLSREAQQYISSTGPFANTVVFKQTDVTKWNEIHDLISFSVITFNDVPDIYAPVAGIFEPTWSNFWDDEESSYRTMDINVNHPIKLSRLAMRALVGADKQGVVCLVASTAAIRGLYLSSLYCASKHAVLGFAKSMGRADYEEGIKFVCVCPGVVDTPLWRQRDDDMMDMAKFLQRKSVGPDDIAVVMRQMIESDDYEGGSCVVKTADEERIFEKGWKSDAEKYDPSPRPESDLRRVRDALDGERGKKWEIHPATSRRT